MKIHRFTPTSHSEKAPSGESSSYYSDAQKRAKPSNATSSLEQINIIEETPQ